MSLEDRIGGKMIGRLLIKILEAIDQYLTRKFRNLYVDAFFAASALEVQYWDNDEPFTVVFSLEERYTRWQRDVCLLSDKELKRAWELLNSKESYSRDQVLLMERFEKLLLERGVRGSKSRARMAA